MMFRIYALECQLTDQQGNNNLHKFFLELAFFAHCYKIHFITKVLLCVDQRFSEIRSHIRCIVIVCIV